VKLRPKAFEEVVVRSLKEDIRAVQGGSSGSRSNGGVQIEAPGLADRLVLAIPARL
jgi:hypothetical protein